MSAAVPSGWISESTFNTACAALPLVSVDLVLVTPDARLLLGLRTNAPARGHWFTPGGRVRKGELHTTALQRVAAQELGAPMAAQLLGLGSGQLIGAWDHLYTDSAFADDIATHYVNLPHFWQVPAAWQPAGDAQHAQWRWWDVAEALADPLVHPYARNYVAWAQAQRLPAH